MAGLCSFQVVAAFTCGGRRGFTDCVALNRCDGDINSHLQKHRLSRENVCEKDLILARAGLLELTDEQVKNMTVRPAHRFTSRRQRGRVVRAPDLKSGGHGFKSRSDHLAGVVSRWTLVSTPRSCL